MQTVSTFAPAVKPLQGGALPDSSTGQASRPFCPVAASPSGAASSFVTAGVSSAAGSWVNWTGEGDDPFSRPAQHDPLAGETPSSVHPCTAPEPEGSPAWAADAEAVCSSVKPPAAASASPAISQQHGVPVSPASPGSQRDEADGPGSGTNAAVLAPLQQGLQQLRILTADGCRKLDPTLKAELSFLLAQLAQAAGLPLAPCAHGPAAAPVSASSGQENAPCDENSAPVEGTPAAPAVTIAPALAACLSSAAAPGGCQQAAHPSSMPGLSALKHEIMAALRAELQAEGLLRSR